MSLLPPKTDEYFMRQALLLAADGQEVGEIPVGAVVVLGERIIARAHNQSQRLQDCTAHAEMLAITAAQHFLHARYLDVCTLYVSVEPCVMCAGAMYWSQLGRLVYGAPDDARGFLRYGRSVLHPKTAVTKDVLAHEATHFLQAYFRALRSR